MSFGQFAATSQFYLYGRSNCTRTGWLKHSSKYGKPDILDTIDLSGRVYMVTGANNGIGKELTRYLSSKNGKVYMICRSMERAEVARNDLITKHNCPAANLKILLADCSLEADVRRMWGQFLADEQRLDALVCNAGTIMNEKTFTSEGVEVTFAAHLLFGTYLLGSLAIQMLESTPESRLVVVSSGGMYNSKFPEWREAASVGVKKYDGQFAYAYAKRGQVLLCERWAEQFSKVKVVSCHPGWCRTEGVEAVYGSQASYLEPLRSLWEGSEGIAWLCVAPTAGITGGAFYLDREPQVKHLSGPFFTEGSFTKNTKQEVDQMMAQLDHWANGRRPPLAECVRLADLELPLKPLQRSVSTTRFMGKWHVLAVIPTPFEVGASNGIETYTYDETKGVIDVAFEMAGVGGKSPSTIKQRATVTNAPLSSQWAICPQVAGIYLPLNLTYLIIDVAEDYSTCMIGVPDRSYLWVMTRQKPQKKGPRSAVIVKVGNGNGVGVGGVAVGGVGSESSAAEHSTEEMSAETEEAVLKHALERAEAVGYDTKKILMVEWTK